MIVAVLERERTQGEAEKLTSMASQGTWRGDGELGSPRSEATESNSTRSSLYETPGSPLMLRRGGAEEEANRHGEGSKAVGGVSLLSLIFQKQ